MKKTNAIRILESKNFKFEILEYEFKEDEIDAKSVAMKIDVPAYLVFKTLVTVGDKTGINVFCIPANNELDLKKSATASGNKKIEMLKLKDLRSTTGYIRGGCSPIGMIKKYPTYIDEISQFYDEIYVSAGARGIQIKISPDELISITEGQYKDLI